MDLKLTPKTARFRRINSSNSRRGSGAGPSRVTVNLSVYKAFKTVRLHVFHNTSACDSY